MRASSRQATALAATTRSWKAHDGANSVTHTKTGIRTTELPMRFQAGATDPARTLTRATSVPATSHLSEPTRAALELDDGAVQIAGPEIRRGGRRDRVHRLSNDPRKEVNDPA